MDDVDFGDIDRHIDSAQRNLDNGDKVKEYETKEELSVPAVTMMSSYESNHFDENRSDGTQIDKKTLLGGDDGLMNLETGSSLVPHLSKPMSTDAAEKLEQNPPNATLTSLDNTPDSEPVTIAEAGVDPITTTGDETMNNEPTPFKPLTSQDVDQGPLYAGTPKSIKRDELGNVEPRHNSSFSEQWSDPLNSFQTDS